LVVYEDILLVYVGLWCTLCVYRSRALASLSIVISRVVPGTMNIHHSASEKSCLHIGSECYWPSRWNSMSSWDDWCSRLGRIFLSVCVWKIRGYVCFPSFR
jgi:hypothetical protein